METDMTMTTVQQKGDSLPVHIAKCGASGAVTIIPQVGMLSPPEIILEQARTAAKALVSVLTGKKKKVIMNGEQYLEFEDWQTCGQFYNYGVTTGDAVPCEIDGVKGAHAHAQLVNLHTGEVLGGAEAYCMRDEEHWNTRPKYEWKGEGKERKKVKVGDEIVPWFQLASMAQTRAGAKALRNRLAWVVVLAGYRPTPAEELTEAMLSEDKEKSGEKQESSEYWCKEHKTLWFKRGKMKNYAHPFDGPQGKVWCNMPEPNVLTMDTEDYENALDKELEPQEATGTAPIDEKPKVAMVSTPTVPQDDAIIKGWELLCQKVHHSTEQMDDKGKANRLAGAVRAFADQGVTVKSFEGRPPTGITHEMISRFVTRLDTVAK